LQNRSEYEASEFRIEENVLEKRKQKEATGEA
jgi:hypothetical protein